VGTILFIGGAGKAFGWFGGMGVEATIQAFTTHTQIPAWLGYVSIAAELAGGALLVIGCATRLAALALAINMVVAGIVTIPMGFMAVAAYPFSLAVSAVAILLTGPMRYSVDAAVWGDPDLP
jgi:putative oxidoreductase